MEALLRAVTLKNYLPVADRCGIHGRELLRKHQITPAMIANPDNLLPYANVLRLLEDSAEQSGQESFGLLMAESRTLADHGDVSLLISHQPTLRDALAVAIDYGNLINQHFALSIEPRGKQVFLHEETLASSDLPKRQAVELSTALLNRLCASILGDQWHPRLVCFSHAKPSSLTIHERVFHAKLEFNASSNGILCDASALDLPNPRADPEMAAIARKFMGGARQGLERELVFTVRKAVYLLLPLGKAKVKHIAPSLGMSVRTLQRHLDDWGLSFSDLVNEVRREMVLGHLGNKGNDIEQVARMLGYTKPTSFTRWFKSQYGVPPQQWRASAFSHSAHRL